MPEEVKEYAVYSPPWWDNHGSGCVDPGYGIARSFIKDEIKVKTPFSVFYEKFQPTKIEVDLGYTSEFAQKLPDSPFADVLSFISQDGLIFFLFGVPEGDKTIIWQIYFDDDTKYPPNIKSPRKETTSFKRWLLKQV